MDDNEQIASELKAHIKELAQRFERDTTQHIEQLLQAHERNADIEFTPDALQFESDIADDALRSSANQATRQLLTRGTVDVRALGRSLLRRTGRVIGDNIAGSIFNTNGNTTKFSNNQLGADIFDGLLKSRRNR